jgi:hypothetical protein
MEKKNFSKKPSKRVSNKPTDELTKKRYSKSKFKKEVQEGQKSQQEVDTVKDKFNTYIFEGFIPEE